MSIKAMLIFSLPRKNLKLILADCISSVYSNNYCVSILFFYSSLFFFSLIFTALVIIFFVFCLFFFFGSNFLRAKK